MPNEIEIKFRIENLTALTRALKQAGFKQLTRSTHEMNSLYDLPGQKLRKRGELLRLRKYGETWVLTHKAKGKAGRHKVRVELETRVENGEQMDAILRALGFAPTFRYEKYRAEWRDGTGHLVLDETPIGNFGEIEGPCTLHHANLRGAVLRMETRDSQHSRGNDVSGTAQEIKRSLTAETEREKRGICTSPQDADPSLRSG